MCHFATEGFVFLSSNALDPSSQDMEFNVYIIELRDGESGGKYG